MKTQYIAPEAEIIDLAANEQLALLDGHPDERDARAKRDSHYNPVWSEPEIDVEDE